MRRYTLRFSPVIEREYIEHNSDWFRLTMVIANILGIISTLSLALLFKIFMDYDEPLLYWLSGLSAGVSGISLAIQRHLFGSARSEFFIVSGTLIIQTCWLAIAALLPAPWLQSSFAFFMLVGLFDFLMLPIRYAARAAAGMIFIMLIAATYYTQNVYPTIMGDVGLLGTYITGVTVFGIIVGRHLEIGSRTDFLMRHELDQEKKKSEALLYNAIPPKIAERLKLGGEEIADFLPDVSVMFIDISGFTAFVKSANASLTVKLLNQLFSAFDQQIAGHDCEKIKTIGDAYLIVAGLEEGDRDHPTRMLNLLSALRAKLAVFNTQYGTRFLLRAGIHSGPVVAGVIGKTKFTYDLWGETVNFASRLESSAGPGETLVSQSFAASVSGYTATADTRSLKLKGIGTVSGVVLDLQQQHAA
jgi:class 3 adenylate cyclase